jgi:hypothetical protein
MVAFAIANVVNFEILCRAGRRLVVHAERCRSSLRLFRHEESNGPNVVAGDMHIVDAARQ